MTKKGFNLFDNYSSICILSWANRAARRDSNSNIRSDSLSAWSSVFLVDGESVIESFFELKFPETFVSYSFALPSRSDADVGGGVPLTDRLRRSLSFFFLSFFFFFLFSGVVGVAGDSGSSIGDNLSADCTGDSYDIWREKSIKQINLLNHSKVCDQFMYRSRMLAMLLLLRFLPFFTRWAYCTGWPLQFKKKTFILDQ